jgi:hypothetical protein
VMSYGYPRIGDFEAARKLYESTKPLGGKALPEDIRPIAKYSRRRYMARIYKLSRDEYSITRYGWHADYAYRNPACNAASVRRGRRLISYHRGGEIVIHTPPAWQPGGTLGASAGWESAIGQNWDLVDQVLPHEFQLHCHDSKYYIGLWEDGDYMYYLPHKRGLRFKKDEAGVWRCLNPKPEHKYVLDRGAGRKIMNRLRPVREFVEQVWDMIDNEVIRVNRTRTFETYRWYPARLRRMLSDRQEWLEFACAVKERVGGRRWDYGAKGYVLTNPAGRPTDDTYRPLKRSLQRAHKHLFARVPVPVGELCRKHWLDRG